LSFALAYAGTIGASVYIGVNALDYSGYPDCRPDYIQAMQKSSDWGTRPQGQAITIVAPLINFKKLKLSSWATTWGVPWEQTLVCYSGDYICCGVCDSCQLRLAAFAELGNPRSTSHARLLKRLTPSLRPFPVLPLGSLLSLHFILSERLSPLP